MFGRLCVKVGQARCHERLGASSAIHTARLLSLAENLPAVILIVDQENLIREFLPQLDELVAEGMVILDEVEVIRYVGKNHGG
jgi:uncharacterized protein